MTRKPVNLPASVATRLRNIADARQDEQYSVVFSEFPETLDLAFQFFDSLVKTLQLLTLFRVINAGTPHQSKG